MFDNELKHLKLAYDGIHSFKWKSTAPLKSATPNYLTQKKEIINRKDGIQKANKKKLHNGTSSFTFLHIM